MQLRIRSKSTIVEGASMYISNKILAFGTHETFGDYVIIRTEDYPCDSGMRRTTYRGTIAEANGLANRGKFENKGTPDANMFVGVEVKLLKKFHPAMCVTTKDLLLQYEVMQQDDREKFEALVKTMGGVDISKDPALKTKASQLWSAQLASQTEMVVG